MRKRDEVRNLDSCLNKARDDEWVFVLLGRDPAAPAAVLAWVAERIRLGKNAPGDAQLTEAERWVATVIAEGARSGTLTVSEARRQRICRICRKPVNPGPGCPAGWQFDYGEMVHPERITLAFGDEFAHTDCLKPKENDHA